MEGEEGGRGGRWKGREWRVEGEGYSDNLNR